MIERPASSTLSALFVHGPRGAFRWTAFVLAATAFMAAVPTPLYPIYEKEFGFGPAVLGLVFGAYTVGVLTTLFLLAPNAERLGRRPLLGLGMGLTALGAVTFALATGVVWLAVGRVITGLAVGATTSVATAAMSDLEPHRDQHHVARVAVAANFGGFAVGVAMSGLVVQYAPYPTHLVYVLPVLASAIGALALRATPETATELGRFGPLGVQEIHVPASVRRPFWVAAGGIAACYAIYGFFAALAPSYLRTGLAIQSPAATGGVVGLMFGMAAITQLLTAQVRDRRALLVGFPLLLVTVVALVIVISLTTWPPLVVVTAGLGAAVGLTFMGSTTLVDRVAPDEERGEILAGFYSAGYLSLAVPTIGVAEASEVVGITSAGALFGTVLAVAVTVLYVAIWRTPTPPGGGGRPRDPPAPRPRPRAAGAEVPGEPTLDR